MSFQVGLLSPYRVDLLTPHQVEALSLSYCASYRLLSETYKSPDEMRFYTPDYFRQKVQNMLTDKESDVFVLSRFDEPVGFARFSPVPSVYKRANGGGYYSEQNETVQGGVLVRWTRSAYFRKGTPLTDRTTILNQIYLRPDIQKQGVGSLLLKRVLPIVARKYTDLIVEYNQNNKYAIRFYERLGIQEVAKTQDLDQVTPSHDYFSPVGIGYAPIRVIRKRLAQKALFANGRNMFVLLSDRLRERGRTC